MEKRTVAYAEISSSHTVGLVLCRTEQGHPTGKNGDGEVGLYCIKSKGFSNEMPPKIKLEGDGGATLMDKQMPFHEVG